MGRKKGGGYTRRSVLQWERLLGEQASSGVSQRAFCDQRGLSHSSFYNWKRRLGEGVIEESSAAKFIELAVEPREATQWEVEFTLSQGVVLRVRRG